MPGTDFALRNQDYARKLAAQPAPAATDSKADSSPDSSFGFGDLIDIVNPLQHIPVVSTIYQHLTGDKIGVGEKIAGDTLYGGLVGFIGSIGDAIFTQVTGKSVGDTVYAALIGNDKGAPTTAVAANEVLTPDKEIADPGTMTQAVAAYGASLRLSEAY
jgi:hypothetical protein